MSQNTRAQLEAQLLTAPADLAGTVRRTVDGFTAVLEAVEAARNAQKAHRSARNLNMIVEAAKKRGEADKAEKALDSLVAHWQAEMKPKGKQMDMFG